MDASLRTAARDAIGFMPEDEGLALHDAALRAARVGPLLEIGSYCGKSAVYLGAAARRAGTIVYSIDHHRGSEEHQPGQEYHDPRLVDPASGGIDTLPAFLATMRAAGLDDVVVAIVGSSEIVASGWSGSLGMVFLDGSHSSTASRRDYECWAPHVAAGGLLAIHDVFPDPADGGRPPFEVFERAVASGAFEEIAACGSLRVLERVADGF